MSSAWIDQDDKQVKKRGEGRASSRRIGGSMYYRTEAFGYISGRFGGTPRSAKMPCFIAFSRVFVVVLKSHL